MAKPSAKNSQLKQHAQKNLDDAQVIANGIKKPDQSKEQTKLVAQGIQKGIELYKKQQKAKARELDKQKKKASKLDAESQPDEAIDAAQKRRFSHWLPWLLLIASWAGFAAYLSPL